MILRSRQCFHAKSQAANRAVFNVDRQITILDLNSRYVKDASADP